MRLFGGANSGHEMFLWHLNVLELRSNSVKRIELANIQFAGLLRQVRSKTSQSPKEIRSRTYDPQETALTPA